METVADFILGGSKITADGDYNHETKRHLFLKSYDQPRQHIKKQRHCFVNKVHLVKAMIFPVVMYGCESWTRKKAEHWRINAFELWCWSWLLNPLDCKEIHPVPPKGNQSWIFIGRTDAEAETPIFGHLMWRTDSIEKTLIQGKIEGWRSGGQQRMRWLDGITDSVDMSLSLDRECYSPCDRKESDTTMELN